MNLDPPDVALLEGSQHVEDRVEATPPGGRREHVDLLLLKYMTPPLSLLLTPPHGHIIERTADYKMVPHSFLLKVLNGAGEHQGAICFRIMGA